MTRIAASLGITNSVGRKGKNITADVRTIQQLLNRHRIPGHVLPLKEDGIAGPKTLTRIEDFQKFHVKIKPDGRVDPDGKTIAALNKSAEAAGKPVKVTYSPRLKSDKRIVSPYSFSVIRLALQIAAMPQAVITSTIRTPEEQARIMYKNARKNLS